jgi:two-component system, NtrC family, response regulator AtoC
MLWAAGLLVAVLRCQVGGMLLQTLLLTQSKALESRVSRLLEPGLTALTTVDALPRPAPEGPCCDLVLVERSMLGTVPGRSVDRLARLPDDPHVVVLSDREDPNERATLVVAGCQGVINVSLSDPLFAGSIEVFIRRRREEHEQRLGVRQNGDGFPLQEFERLRSLRQLYRTAQRVAAADSSLLIGGETGAGKEWVARAIHAAGPRAERPFVPMHCAAIPEALLESELFGHERGAFTGATTARRGQFEVAHGGTLLLDEIGDMPLGLQAKLLRVLQDKTIQRLGSERSFKVDVRVMATTHRDLGAEVRAGRFREDLMYRLAVVVLEVPPLRERSEDIPRLAQALLARFRKALGRPVWGIQAEAMEVLLRYRWPGNIRELGNVIEHAVLLAQGDEIAHADLPPTLRGEATPHDTGFPDGDALTIHVPGWRSLTLPELRNTVVAQAERQHLETLLAETGGRLGDAAHRAGIDRRTLYERMRVYGLDKRQFKT